MLAVGAGGSCLDILFPFSLKLSYELWFQMAQPEPKAAGELIV